MYHATAGDDSGMVLKIHTGYSVFCHPAAIQPRVVQNTPSGMFGTTVGAGTTVETTPVTTPIEVITNHGTLNA